MIVVRKIDWNKETENHFEKCQSDDFSIRDMMREWMDEKAFLLGVFECEKYHIGSILLRPDGQELVVLAAGGHTIDGSSYRFLMPFLKTIASSFGFMYLRAHALDEGRGRLLEQSGWGKPERVYRIRLED